MLLLCLGLAVLCEHPVSKMLKGLHKHRGQHRQATDSVLTAATVGMCAQVLASIGQLEFFYDQAPDVMRSCSMALQLLSVAIGSYLSGAVVLAVSYLSDYLGCDWLPQDLNYGRLDLFFLLLAGGPLVILGLCPWNACPVQQHSG